MRSCDPDPKSTDTAIRGLKNYQSKPLLNALWSLVDVIWGISKGSWGLLDIPNIQIDLDMILVWSPFAAARSTAATWLRATSSAATKFAPKRWRLGVKVASNSKED